MLGAVSKVPLSAHVEGVQQICSLGLLKAAFCMSSVGLVLRVYDGCVQQQPHTDVRSGVASAFLRLQAPNGLICLKCTCNF